MENIQIFHDWNQFWNAALMMLLSALIGGLSLLVKNIFALIAQKTLSVKNEQIRAALLVAESEAERLTNTVIVSLNQTAVNVLKEKNGGKLTVEDAERVKNEAVNTILNLLSDEAHSILLERKGDITNYILHLLEESVSRNKK